MFVQLFASNLEGAIKVCDEARRLYNETKVSHPDEPVRICVMREHEDMMRVRCPDAVIESVGPDVFAVGPMIGDLFRAAEAAVRVRTEATVVVITDGHPTSRALHSRFLEAVRMFRFDDVGSRHANAR